MSEATCGNTGKDPGYRFAHPGYDHKHAFSFSRQALSEVYHFVRSLEVRGRGEDRVRAAPAVSCALMHKEMRTRAPTIAPERR